MLVLDEPTAHLDPETADELMRDIFATAGDRSILLITHRREGLDLVGRVIELETTGARTDRLMPAPSSSRSVRCEPRPDVVEDPAGLAPEHDRAAEVEDAGGEHAAPFSIS